MKSHHLNRCCTLCTASFGFYQVANSAFSRILCPRIVILRRPRVNAFIPLTWVTAVLAWAAVKQFGTLRVSESRLRQDSLSEIYVVNKFYKTLCKFYQELNSLLSSRLSSSTPLHHFMGLLRFKQTLLRSFPTLKNVKSSRISDGMQRRISGPFPVSEPPITFALMKRFSSVSLT